MPAELAISVSPAESPKRALLIAPASRRVVTRRCRVQEIGIGQHGVARGLAPPKRLSRHSHARELRQAAAVEVGSPLPFAALLAFLPLRSLLEAFGYATDETPEMMPLSHLLATRPAAERDPGGHGRFGRREGVGPQHKFVASCNSQALEDTSGARRACHVLTYCQAEFDSDLTS